MTSEFPNFIVFRIIKFSSNIHKTNIYGPMDVTLAFAHMLMKPKNPT